MMSKDDIRQTITNYILEQFLPGERPDALQDTTPLISGGILNSIATMKLVSFIEDNYKIEFKTHEINADYLEDIDRITNFVAQRLSQK